MSAESSLKRYHQQAFNSLSDVGKPSSTIADKQMKAATGRGSSA